MKRKREEVKRFEGKVRGFRDEGPRKRGSGKLNLPAASYSGRWRR